MSRAARGASSESSSNFDSPHLGLLPLPIAVEKADIAAVAMLLHYKASPDKRPSTGHATAREYAHRMLAGVHADKATRAGRQVLSCQHEAATRILRLFSAPTGDECLTLYTAFMKRLDALEEERQRRESHRHVATAAALVLVVVLYFSGLLGVGHLGERDLRELL